MEVSVHEYTLRVTLTRVIHMDALIWLVERSSQSILLVSPNASTQHETSDADATAIDGEGLQIIKMSTTQDANSGAE